MKKLILVFFFGLGFMSELECNKPICEDIITTPIYTHSEAQQKCPNVCKDKKKTWNGQWNSYLDAVTMQPAIAVCGCCNK
jgi:hypothetical protein